MNLINLIICSFCFSKDEGLLSDVIPSSFKYGDTSNINLSLIELIKKEVRDLAYLA